MVLPRQEPSGEGWPLLQALGTSLCLRLQEPPKAARVPTDSGLRAVLVAGACRAHIAPAPAWHSHSAHALALLRTPGSSLGTGAEDRLPNPLQMPGSKYCGRAEERAGTCLQLRAVGPNGKGRDCQDSRVRWDLSLPRGSFPPQGSCGQLWGHGLACVHLRLISRLIPAPSPLCCSRQLRLPPA